MITISNDYTATHILNGKNYIFVQYLWCDPLSITLFHIHLIKNFTKIFVFNNKIIPNFEKLNIAYIVIAPSIVFYAPFIELEISLESLKVEVVDILTVRCIPSSITLLQIIFSKNSKSSNFLTFLQTSVPVIITFLSLHEDPVD